MTNMLRARGGHTSAEIFDDINDPRSHGRNECGGMRRRERFTVVDASRMGMFDIGEKCTRGILLFIDDDVLRI